MSLLDTANSVKKVIAQNEEELNRDNIAELTGILQMFITKHWDELQQAAEDGDTSANFWDWGTKDTDPKVATMYRTIDRAYGIAERIVKHKRKKSRWFGMSASDPLIKYSIRLQCNGEDFECTIEAFKLKVGGINPEITVKFLGSCTRLPAVVPVYIPVPVPIKKPVFDFDL
jgi:hypothetical protein